MSPRRALHSVLLVLVFIVTPSLAGAADLRITDSSGTHVIVRNATLDYAAGIAAVRESKGIRVQQGDGTVTLKWADVQSLTVLHRGEGGKEEQLEVDVTLRNGRHTTATLTRVRDT